MGHDAKEPSWVCCVPWRFFFSPKVSGFGLLDTIQELLDDGSYSVGGLIQASGNCWLAVVTCCNRSKTLLGCCIRNCLKTAMSQSLAPRVCLYNWKSMWLDLCRVSTQIAFPSSSILLEPHSTALGFTCHATNDFWCRRNISTRPLLDSFEFRTLGAVCPSGGVDSRKIPRTWWIDTWAGWCQTSSFSKLIVNKFVGSIHHFLLDD